MEILFWKVVLFYVPRFFHSFQEIVHEIDYEFVHRKVSTNTARTDKQTSSNLAAF